MRIGSGDWLGMLEVGDELNIGSHQTCVVYIRYWWTSEAALVCPSRDMLATGLTSFTKQTLARCRIDYARTREQIRETWSVTENPGHAQRSGIIKCNHAGSVWPYNVLLS